MDASAAPTAQLGLPPPNRHDYGPCGRRICDGILMSVRPGLWMGREDTGRTLGLAVGAAALVHHSASWASLDARARLGHGRSLGASRGGGRVYILLRRHWCVMEVLSRPLGCTSVVVAPEIETCASP
eukprot:scaffold27325_cov243-Isochrysis_galbana.AAC.4